MKKLWSLGVIGLLLSCGGTGDRTYDAQTQTDTAGVPMGETINDTTATTNNNAYNPDSATGRGTTYDTAAHKDSGHNH